MRYIKPAILSTFMASKSIMGIPEVQHECRQRTGRNTGLPYLLLRHMRRTSSRFPSEVRGRCRGQRPASSDLGQLFLAHRLASVDTDPGHPAQASRSSQPEGCQAKFRSRDASRARGWSGWCISKG